MLRWLSVDMYGAAGEYNKILPTLALPRFTDLSPFSLPPFPPFFALWQSFLFFTVCLSSSPAYVRSPSLVASFPCFFSPASIGIRPTLAHSGCKFQVQGYFFVGWRLCSFPGFPLNRRSRARTDGTHSTDSGLRLTFSPTYIGFDSVGIAI